MASRRMTSNSVCATADFLSMSKPAQALYHLMMLKTDDEGAVEASLVIRLGSFKRNALQELIDRGYVEPLDERSQVCWICHFDEQNRIQKDRFHASPYHHQIQKLRSGKAVRRSETVHAGEENHDNNGLCATPDGNRMLTEGSKGKDSSGKASEVQSLHTPSKDTPEKQKKRTYRRNSFNDFEQHPYDFDALEKELINAPRS